MTLDERAEALEKQMARTASPIMSRTMIKLALLAVVEACAEVLVTRAAELDASSEVSIAQGDLSAPSDEQAYAACQLRLSAQQIRQEVGQ